MDRVLFQMKLLPADGHGLADPGPLPGEGGHLAPGHARLHLLPGGGVRPGQRHPLVLVPGVSKQVSKVSAAPRRNSHILEPTIGKQKPRRLPLDPEVEVGVLDVRHAAADGF